ncbi:hypothetical protein CHGG_03478 [Chaetomium globosum CBS 148.51]|uniref:Rhamnogalacturonase A/B/Epimerase-like pectate lyase domain-containing protein n=1 Tax=Chaetomium globosum (strain ATCC 6205 / CBS 148.51 / DSM 1962 / NBRC 6347 / NRRL 1970) TaxID=306901 RepID=Q2H8H6_CHAGB|nr:uncharacterized protein CHGG_03478 [Chaetomium globosum CBS 148.51]EAQ91543.1 hypothetical protein CHGG_03478 [Chaetomium globosum CBS 148.51]
MLSRISTVCLLALGLVSPALAVPGTGTGTRQDYGAKGDGAADDTDAINQAISDGNRCGENCTSQTTTPALVYFPSGTYVVSKPIIPFYYTQLVGDALAPPTLKASADFAGMAVIDADPYDSTGKNWWTNQNNFFRQVRNFVIDLTGMPVEVGAGIHWQVAQATSLQNIVFNMREDGGDANKQQGIFMDNGSGGFMSDLTFNGGNYGGFFGNQQFTTRNLTFNNCKTAVFMNWNWAWVFHDIKINNCGVGIDMSNGGPDGQTVGSVLVLDSEFTNTPVGIKTAYDPSSPHTNGTLILENVDMTGSAQAVFNNATGATILEGNQKVSFFAQGRGYGGAGGNSGDAFQGPQEVVKKPAVLLQRETGKIITRSKPQYENVPAGDFISIKKAGAKGDGVTDDSDAIQKVFDTLDSSKVIFFDHGAYLVTKTIRVPKEARIVGEVLPMILAGGDSTFKDQEQPAGLSSKSVKPGDIGTVEMSDLIFGTAGPQPGAIMMEWNLKAAAATSAALWDVHTRIGGYRGTNLELEQCAKNPNVTNPINPDCFGAFMMLHVTPGAGIYLENTWYWHSVLYNYQFNNASNVFLGHIQTETPYYQPNPDSTEPFPPNPKFADPDFATSCADDTTGTCKRAWGVRAVDSKDIFIYGAGLYSFFDNYAQDCLETESCQANIASLEGGSEVYFFGLNTKASVNMVSIDGQSAALDSQNRNTFCATLAWFQRPS